MKHKTDYAKVLDALIVCHHSKTKKGYSWDSDESNYYIVDQLGSVVKKAKSIKTICAYISKVTPLDIL